MGAGKVLVNLTVGRDPVRSLSECAINSCDFWAEGKKDEKHALPLSLPCMIFLVAMVKHLSYQVHDVLSKKQ